MCLLLGILDFSSSICKALKVNEIVNVNINSCDDSGVRCLKGFMQVVACVKLLLCSKAWMMDWLKISLL